MQWISELPLIFQVAGGIILAGFIISLLFVLVVIVHGIWEAYSVPKSKGFGK